MVDITTKRPWALRWVGLAFLAMSACGSAAETSTARQDVETPGATQEAETTGAAQEAGTPFELVADAERADGSIVISVTMTDNSGGGMKAAPYLRAFVPEHWTVSLLEGSAEGWLCFDERSDERVPAAPVIACWPGERDEAVDSASLKLVATRESEWEAPGMVRLDLGPKPRQEYEPTDRHPESLMTWGEVLAVEDVIFVDVGADAPVVYSEPVALHVVLPLAWPSEHYTDTPVLVVATDEDVPLPEVLLPTSGTLVVLPGAGSYDISAFAYSSGRSCSDGASVDLPRRGPVEVTAAGSLSLRADGEVCD